MIDKIKDEIRRGRRKRKRRRARRYNQPLIGNDVKLQPSDNLRDSPIPGSAFDYAGVMFAAE